MSADQMDTMRDLRHDARERRTDIMMARHAAASLHGPGGVPPPGVPRSLRGRLSARRNRANAAEFRDRLADYQGNMRDMVQDFQMNRRDMLQDLHGV